ncbi:alanine racemase [Ectothiorhodospiraceae bacterium 2226]|nr:alanine racemase [Ectothiorhodospiraceae bacterium 2226]
MRPPVHARIDLGALAHNLALARTAARGAKIMAIIKADAYGHGLVTVARALDADALGVARLDEALALREAGVTRRIAVLEGYTRRDELELLARHRLEPVVHQEGQIALLEEAEGVRLPAVWLKVDTGMHRLGFPPERARAAWARLDALRPRLGGIVLMSHLARADDRADETTAAQLARFDEAVGGLPGERAIANSGGLLGWPEARSDWARPGIMLYGVSPFHDQHASELGLRPVMTLCSRVIAVQSCKAGESVGYGGSYTCPTDMTIGVVAIGYGDGYPRQAPNGTPVLVNGRRAVLVGRVSMDMIMVDLRGHPPVQPGDPVVLWGEGLAVEEVARHAGTIPYDLLCGVSRRVPRVVAAPHARVVA